MPVSEQDFHSNADSCRISVPRLIITALSGGGGKTLLSLGLAGALRDRGLLVLPFKKGPDYIDAAWLAAATGQPASNLDPFFLSGPRLKSLFVHSVRTRVSPATLAAGAALALVEGNRGIFDGMDLEGSCSTASLARDLAAPLLLSVNVTKMTRTAAALVQGIVGFEKGLHFAGVVLNQVGRPRHADYLRKTIEAYTDLPVLGELPRLAQNPLPERHMGIASLLGGDRLSEQAGEGLRLLKKLVLEHVDIDRVLAAARTAGELVCESAFWPPAEKTPAHGSVAPRIGYVRDAALWFYYPENLEALERAGARLERVSLFGDEAWNFDGPSGLDAVYLGGGFPEDYLEALSVSPRLRELAFQAKKGLPVYAECGGFMVLSRSITLGAQSWPMGGVLPLDIVALKRPQGLGYVEAEVTRPTPYYPAGLYFRGHEFHYSRPAESCSGQDTHLRLSRGTGLGDGRDGLTAFRTWGSYTHIFAPSVPSWAEGFVHEARQRRLERLGTDGQ